MLESVGLGRVAAFSAAFTPSSTAHPRACQSWGDAGTQNDPTGASGGVLTEGTAAPLAR